MYFLCLLSKWKPTLAYFHDKNLKGPVLPILSCITRVTTLNVFHQKQIPVKEQNTTSNIHIISGGETVENMLGKNNNKKKGYVIIPQNQNANKTSNTLLKTLKVIWHKRQQN